MAQQQVLPDLVARISALCEGEDDVIAKMATISCELYHAVDGYDWVGFYRVTEPQMLKIGPYQGGHGCLTIPFSKGVCGTAARLATTQLVDNVNAFEGHIACSSATQSELVLPIFDKTGAVMAVLDIDSNKPAFFSSDDAAVLETLMAALFGK